MRRRRHVHAHLAAQPPGHEVVDNSVDEATSGYATQIDVTLFKDGSLEVTDNGPWHAGGHPSPGEGQRGRADSHAGLHAGGKFSEKAAYKFSGGLHGVGVSVVNALSSHLDCTIRRGGKEYRIEFKDGKLQGKLAVVGTVGQRNTGTTVRFWPDPKFFDSDKFSVPQLRHTLKAKAVLCAGLRITFTNEATGEKDEWFYSGDLGAYLLEELESTERCPRSRSRRHARGRPMRSVMRCCGRRTCPPYSARAM